MWASYEAGLLEDERAAGDDLDEHAALGLLYSPAPYSLAYVDPIEDEDIRPDGESERGIDLRLHPRRLLELEPRLWGIVDRWRTGITTRPRLGMSYFEVECLAIMCAAAEREAALRLEALKQRAGVHD